jgi:hypothetical protein
LNILADRIGRSKRPLMLSPFACTATISEFQGRCVLPLSQDRVGRRATPPRSEQGDEFGPSHVDHGAFPSQPVCRTLSLPQTSSPRSPQSRLEALPDDALGVGCWSVRGRRGQPLPSRGPLGLPRATSSRTQDVDRGQTRAAARGEVGGVAPSPREAAEGEWIHEDGGRARADRADDRARAAAAYEIGRPPTEAALLSTGLQLLPVFDSIFSGSSAVRRLRPQSSCASGRRQSPRPRR